LFSDFDLPRMGKPFRLPPIPRVVLSLSIPENYSRQLAIALWFHRDPLVSNDCHALSSLVGCCTIVCASRFPYRKLCAIHHLQFEVSMSRFRYGNGVQKIRLHDLHRWLGPLRDQ